MDLCLKDKVNRQVKGQTIIPPKMLSFVEYFYLLPCFLFLLFFLMLSFHLQDMTGGVLEENLNSLQLKEGTDYHHFN